MNKKLHKFFIIVLLILPLCACYLTVTTVERSNLFYGKRLFDEGLYRRAMNILLPLACDGNPEAQYAVGYMYYYGYGVAQDTDVGCFWISRSASKGYPPAQVAIHILNIKRINPVYGGKPSDSSLEHQLLSRSHTIKYRAY